MIESINGANVVFSSEAIATGIGVPIFTWGGNLISVTLKLIPIMILISFIRIIYKFFKNLWKKKNTDSKKDLYNK